MTAFQLRPATPQDADAIAEVHTVAMRTAMPYLPALHTDDETRAWIVGTVLPHQEVWVAEADGRVVGVAALEDDMLQQLYLLPGYQGIGIGSALLAKAKALRPGGFSFYAFGRNVRARAFYEGRGCVAVEFGDGSGNEEGEPDVRYRWSPTEGVKGAEGDRGEDGAHNEQRRDDPGTPPTFTAASRS